MANEMKSGSTLTEKRTKRQEKDPKASGVLLSKWLKRNKRENEKNEEALPNDDSFIKNLKIYRTRMFPIWLRIVIVLVLLLLAAIFGLMIGYGLIGDGKLMDALKWETYQHILDIMNGEE
ncbi:DNA-directed RNA polymerase subunit beta [Ureibacillus sp. FSL K6-3587]|uniref:DNA-directed RNA polymerase subunit beta n=1 Tax=Ureibacillus sp. FSL K6-3587 TaxID=2954681 RepID=UPI0031588D40